MYVNNIGFCRIRRNIFLQISNMKCQNYYTYMYKNTNCWFNKTCDSLCYCLHQKREKFCSSWKWLQVQRQVNFWFSYRKTWQRSFSLECLLVSLRCWSDPWLDGFMFDFGTILKKSFGTCEDFWPKIFNKPLLCLWSLGLPSLGKLQSESELFMPNICCMNRQIFLTIDSVSLWQFFILLYLRLCCTNIFFNIFLLWSSLQFFFSVTPSEVIFFMISL